MISETELREVAARTNLPLSLVEKDYVMGWLLWGIYHNPLLVDSLVLKGGNCLRKVYFPATRFSDDLDFTARRPDAAALFAQQIPAVCRAVQACAGIAFDLDALSVRRRPTPASGCQAIEGRLYFHGQQGRGSISLRIKFDVSEYERIALPLQRHRLQHPYSDRAACQAQVLTYSLEEQIAEKLRSWIQRTRPRDLFDVVHILESGAVPISYGNILRAFLDKTTFKHVPLAGRDEMLAPAKFASVTDHWERAIIGVNGHLPPVTTAIEQFTAFIQELFNPALLTQVGPPGAPSAGPQPVPSAIREALIAAGKARQMVRLAYGGRSRDVEPYSFRYRMLPDGTGVEYFYGFDHSRGQTIKSFFLSKIEGVSMLPLSFQPRWDVEF